MKLRLVIAVLVLAVAAGFLYWPEHRRPNAEASPSFPEPLAILHIDQQKVTKLTITTKGQEPVALTKAGTDDWQITEPKPLRADQDAVASLFSTLASLDAERVVEEKPTDLKQYGLAQPAVQVSIISGDKTQNVLIGDDTPVGGMAFAMVEGDPRVFTTSSVNKIALDKGLNDLRDKRLLTVNFDKLQKIELVKNSQGMEFEREGEGWKIAKPKPYRADPIQIEELLSELREARMDLTGSGNQDLAAAFAHAAPLATAKVTDGETTQVLQLRKSKDEYYAKSSAVEGVYKVDSALGQALDKNLDDFRNKKLFDFSFNDPDKVELRGGNIDDAFTRSNEDWWSNGKKVDSDGVESFISKLRDLSADKFPNSGFRTPELTVTVISEEGKKVEKVLIAKSGKDYIGKREDGPDLYQLKPDAVEDIEAAASAIKPAGGTGKTSFNAVNPGK